MATKKDVKPSTVETQVKRGVAAGLTVEQAKKVAIESAERVNRKRQEGK